MCVFPKYVTNIQLFIGKRDICILTTNNTILVKIFPVKQNFVIFISYRKFSQGKDNFEDERQKCQTRLKPNLKIIFPYKEKTDIA